MTGWQFLIISLIVHLLLYSGAERFAPPAPARQDIVEISVQDSSQNSGTKMQIVQQKVPKLNDLKPKNPRYYSEHTQTVEKEMQARANGLTKNRSQTGKRGQDFREEVAQNGSPSQSEDGEGSAASRKRLRELHQQLFGGISTNSNHLEDVPEGPMTILSSDRFTYYSFYERVNEKVYPSWVAMVRESFNRLNEDDSRRLRSTEYLTKLDIVVNPNGNVESAIILQSCGIEAFDQAAKRAFLNARQFPNPPKGMIKEDGKIHLMYGVFVQPENIAYAQ